MIKRLLPYHSSYGHIQTMAQAVAEGERQSSAIELDGARFQGKLVAEAANKRFG